MTDAIPSLPPPRSHSLGKHGRQSGVAGHVVLPWQPAVVEGVHVDHGVRLHHDRGLGLVLDPPLAGERQPDLIGHGTTEGALGRNGDRKHCYQTKSTVITPKSTIITPKSTFITPECATCLCLSRRLLKLGSAGGNHKVWAAFKASAVLGGTSMGLWLTLCFGRSCAFDMLNRAERQSWGCLLECRCSGCSLLAGCWGLLGL